jgi:hypothetical protein
MLWFAGTLMTPATAVARAHEPDRVVLVLHDASPAAGVLGTFDRMHEQFGELDLDISAVDLPRVESLEGQAERAATIAAAERAKAVFWFVEVTHGVIRLYALHAASGRVFARDVALRGDATAQREQLSLVLRAAIPAALDGGRTLGKPVWVVPPEVSARSGTKQEGELSSDGDEANDTDAALVAADERAEPWKLAVALGYIGSSIAEDLEWQSGAAVDVICRAPRAFRASIGAGYAAKTTIRGAGADANVSRVPIEGRLGVERALGPGNLTLEAGALLDIWRRRTRVRSDALVPTAPSTTLLWGGVLGVRVEAPLTSGVGLFLSLEAQWLPSDYALSVRSSQGEQQEQARTLRPEIGTGLVFELGSGENDRGRAE